MVHRTITITETTSTTTEPDGADLLPTRGEPGYEEGYNAGARTAGWWGFEYQNSDAYLDGTFGYDGYYVDAGEYQHYFREGFRRGYEDGYYERNQYGRNQGGKLSILADILRVILNLQGF